MNPLAMLVSNNTGRGPPPSEFGRNGDLDVSVTNLVGNNSRILSSRLRRDYTKIEFENPR